MTDRLCPVLQPDPGLQSRRDPGAAPATPDGRDAALHFPVVDLAPAAVHELHAATDADAAALTGAVLALAYLGRGAPGLWVRHTALDHEAGSAYPPGLAAFGLDPGRLILVRAQDALSALKAGLEGARCPALGAVIIEFRGEAKAYDLTASRRLALAAKASGVRVLVTRIAAHPVPSAAETRWRIRAVTSLALPGNAPGNPAFELTLLRARNGQEGLRYHLEWNRDAGSFIAYPGKAGGGTTAPSSPAGNPPPLSRPVVPVLFDRPDPPPPGAFAQRVLPQRALPQRRAG